MPPLSSAAEPQRERIDYDCVIVGAGAAGLSAAIRLKQIDSQINVAVLEKGSEVGAHILSGAVLDPCGLQALLPQWRSAYQSAEVADPIPVDTPVTDEHMYWLSKRMAVPIPHSILPLGLSHKGHYIVSMGNVCRWLARLAESLGVDVLPAMAASDLVYGKQGQVIGVIAGERGKGRDNTYTSAYDPGVHVCARFTLLSEGAHGSLAQRVIKRYGLWADNPQKYALGMKEIWQIPPEQHHKGRIIHTIGWPMHNQARGGGFIYFANQTQVYIGYVVHLDYRNPSLFPYMEFQHYKHHPLPARILKGGQRIAYGARVIASGGWQSLPRLVFPGGALLGCAAGMVNVAKVQGNHNAMLSGLNAAEAVADALKRKQTPELLHTYDTTVRKGRIGGDLYAVRNVKPLWERLGTVAGIGVGVADMLVQRLFKQSVFGTLHHKYSDATATKYSYQCPVIKYPQPDNVLSFDRTTNIGFANVAHNDNQPSHLLLLNDNIPLAVNAPLYNEPAERYCPAGVYSIVREHNNTQRFHISFQNCVHCKACTIKDPSQNIVWTPPEGGDGPNYPNM